MMRAKKSTIRHRQVVRFLCYVLAISDNHSIPQSELVEFLKAFDELFRHRIGARIFDILLVAVHVEDIAPVWNVVAGTFNLKKAVGTCFGIFPAQFCKEITVLARSLRWRRQQVGGGQRPSLEYFGEDPAEDRPPSFVPVQLPRSCFHLQ